MNMPAVNSPSGGMNQMDIAKLAMSFLGQARQQAPSMGLQPMQPMQQMQPMAQGIPAQQFMQQYGMDALLQKQSQEDAMLRQRMQGLMSLIGGQ
jgi:predicted YcjX-like family ATPase